MVDVDKLSDAELRTKLMEFGYPVMPITGTTRKVMVKKLKLLLENQNKAKKDDRRSLGQYSSEEESDTDTTRAAKRDNYNKRATIGGPMMQPPPAASSSSSSRITGRKSTLLSPPPLVPAKSESKTTMVTTRTEKIVRSARDDYDTGSESDDIDIGQNQESFIDHYKTSSPLLSPSSSTSRLPQSFLSASSAADSIADRLNKIRSRSSYYYDKPLSSSSSNIDDTLQDKENTPFLSNFTKTLSQLKESPKLNNSSIGNNSYDYKSDIIKEHDVNNGGGGGNSSGARSYLSSYRQSAVKSRSSIYNNNNTDYHKQTTSNIFKNNFVPFMVLFVAIIFFLVVGLVYVRIKSDSPYEISAAVPRCDDLINRNSLTTTMKRQYVNCIFEKDIKSAIHLFKLIKDELDKRAINQLCNNNQQQQFKKSYMIEDDIINFIQSQFQVNETKLMNDLKTLEFLLLYNQHWAVSLIQLDRDGSQFVDDMIATDMEMVDELRSSKIIGLISTSPPIPWSCYFYNLFTKFLNFLTTFLIGFFVLFIINYCYKTYKQYRQRQHDEELSMVESIIDILQTNCNQTHDDLNNYLVINHVRDMIIPITERKCKEKLWARAVQYINENESRIRTEIQVVKGEPCEVWRWLGGPTINPTKNKIWQGQAFETQLGSVNSLNCSPTPCLKIRGMVEEGDRNVIAIKKAVLTKCAQQCRILHCDVDANCVYLKCADRTDALIAYRNLHGWWYAGNLVTVKYLKLERYMQRFPNSPVNGPPYLQ